MTLGQALAAKVRLTKRVLVGGPQVCCGIPLCFRPCRFGGWAFRI
jgi:hypothetical protein